MAPAAGATLAWLSVVAAFDQFAAALASAGAAGWTPGTPMPAKRMGHEGGVNSTHVFVVAGFNGTAILSSALAYDVKAERWSPMPDLPKPVSDLGAAVLRGKLYTLGGMVYPDDCQHPGCMNYNVSTVFALDLAGGAAWSEAPPMPTARRGMSVAADEARGILYSVGGMNCKSNCAGTDIAYFDTVEAFSVASNTWEVLPPMPTPRRDFGSAVDAEGRLWTVGGCGGADATDGACPTLSVVEIYNPKTRKWQAPAHLQLPEPRHGMLVATDGDALFLIGGSADAGVFNAPKPSTAVWRLGLTGDLSHASWRRMPSLGHPRYGLNKGYGFVVDGKVFAVGGSVGSLGGFLGYVPSPSMEVLDLRASQEAFALAGSPPPAAFHGGGLWVLAAGIASVAVGAAVGPGAWRFARRVHPAPPLLG